MTNLSTKLGSMPIQNVMKKSLAMLVLAMLMTSHQASAKIVFDDEPMTMFSADKPEAIVVEPETPPTVQEVLLSVCQSNGYGEDCAKTLLGMLWTESSNQSTVIGDGGRARGYFQIHYKLHKIPVACAEDLVCSANWSIMYLERNSYPKYVNYAVQCHNSCGVKNGYSAKVVRNAKVFWDKPMVITQAAPIELAVK